MFHEGDIQSGISTAIQQQKLVTCFVYNEGDALSEDWEHDLLPSLRDLIAQKTILLKLKQDSQEAGFLSAFIPMHIAPSIVVINNGTVIVKLQAPMSPEDWQAQMEAALRSRDPATVSSTAAQASAQSAPSQPVATPQPSVATRSTTESIKTGDDATTSEESSSACQIAAENTTDTATGASPSPEPSPSALQSLMPDRAARLEADQATKQAAEKAARVARAEARRKEIEASTTSSSKGKQPAEPSKDAIPKARTDWVREQAKRKEEAKQERERILKQIQADREERKLRAAMAKQAVAPAEPLEMTGNRRTARASTTCALQLRLMDGSSIRKQFDADETLKEHVRAWIKETTTPDAVEGPYTFRQLLVPQPSRSIDVAEEGQSLGSLGLTPSATLILVPDSSQVSSAASSGLLSFLMRIVSTIFGLFATLFSLLSGRGGIGADAEPREDKETRGSATGVEGPSSSIRLRTQTLADSRARDAGPTEFYNGNSSAFEGRKDDDAD